ncbi:hypothetical protein [Microcoleus sp. FACHB-1515]|nr:hypothetical protein [Microcoleus sp. FACHB-1515]
MVSIGCDRRLIHSLIEGTIAAFPDSIAVASLALGRFVDGKTRKI